MSMPDSTSKAWFSIDDFLHAPESQMTALDPVCGKRIDIDTATAHEDHDGWMHFFCSADCRDRFRHNPGQYAGQTRRQRL